MSQPPDYLQRCVVFKARACALTEAWHCDVDPPRSPAFAFFFPHEWKLIKSKVEDDNHARRCRTPALKQTRGFWGDKSLLLQQLHRDSRGSYCEWKWSPISSLMREFSSFWFKCTTCLSTNGVGESCTHAGGWTNAIDGHIQHHKI